MGDPIVSPAERIGRDENSWAMEGDKKEEMIVEVEELIQEVTMEEKKEMMGLVGYKENN